MFQEALDYCQLGDLGFTGSQFTWSNGKEGPNIISERLDRFLVNLEWRQQFQNLNLYQMLVAYLIITQ